MAESDRRPTGPPGAPGPTPTPSAVSTVPASSDADGERGASAPRPKRGWLPPVVAGMILDGVDFATMGPFGLSGGFLLGGLAAAWAARETGFRGRTVWWAALGGAIYAATPATEFLPLGTLIGWIVQVRRR